MTYQYVIQDKDPKMYTDMYIAAYDPNHGFVWGSGKLATAQLFPTATAAENAIRQRNLRNDVSGKAQFIIVPVKATEVTKVTRELVTTWVDTPVTTTVRELA